MKGGVLLTMEGISIRKNILIKENMWKEITPISHLRAMLNCIVMNLRGSVVFLRRPTVRVELQQVTPFLKFPVNRETNLPSNKLLVHPKTNPPLK